MRGGGRVGRRKILYQKCRECGITDLSCVVQKLTSISGSKGFPPTRPLPRKRTALQALSEPQRNRWSKRHSAHNKSRPCLERHLAPRLFTTMVPATMSYTVLLCWKNRSVTKAGKRKAMEKFLLNALMVDLMRGKGTE